MNFDELKQKFGPPLDVKPYGLTIVVQGSEFNPDWEAELGDRGYACHFGKLDKHPVVFVPLKRTVAEGKAVYVPPKVPEIGKAQPMVEKKKYALKGPAWTEENEVELLKEYDRLVSEGTKYGSHKILVKLPQFKDRSVSAIEQKLKRLLRKRRKGEVAVGSQVEQVEKVAKVADVQSEEKRLVCWTTDEVELFVRLWNENPGYKFLAAHFPNRTEIALRQKATELKKKGVIENSYIVKSKLAKNEPLKEAGEVKVEPVGNPAWNNEAYVWSEVETEIIVKCWNTGLRVGAIHVEVVKVSPHRSVKAVTSEIARLQRKGVIKPRFKWKSLKKVTEKQKDANAPMEEKGDASVDLSKHLPVEVAESKAPDSVYLPFGELWSAASGLGTDLKQRAEVFYAAAIKAGWPVDLAESVVSLCCELDALRDWFDNKIAEGEKFGGALESKIEAVLEKFLRHKHAVSGEAMLPMEDSS